jgi:hypothetical protein
LFLSHRNISEIRSTEFDIKKNKNILTSACKCSGFLIMLIFILGKDFLRKNSMIAAHITTKVDKNGDNQRQFYYYNPYWLLLL